MLRENKTFVECDDCGRAGPTPKDANAQTSYNAITMARAAGWTLTAAKDRCPDCRGRLVDRDRPAGNAAATALAEVLEQSGITKVEWSKTSGVSRSLIDEYLKGIRQPTVAQMIRLTKAAGYDLDLTVRANGAALAQPEPAGTS